MTNIDPRRPQDRRVAGDESESPAAPGHKRRRSRSGLDGSETRRGNFMGRLTGRAELDRAKSRRYDPYSYESNNSQLKWAIAALVAWIIVALTLAWQDRSTVEYLSELRDQGVVTVPPTQQSTRHYVQEIAEFAQREGIGLAWQNRSAAAYPNYLNESGFVDTSSNRKLPDRDLEKIFAFNRAEGIACTVELDIMSLSEACSRFFEIQDRYTTEKDNGAMLFVLLMTILVANFFTFGSFTHRSSRNLLTLKSKGQRYSPEKAVFWFFIPGLNTVKPWMVFKELFRGSDPDVTTSDQAAWRKMGKVPVIVHVWAAIFVAVFIFNPRSIGWFWYSIRETISDVIAARQGLIIADLLMAVLGVAAILVVVELNRRQEERHAIVGDITVTPPRPKDPLEEALKDGIRRKELENRRSRAAKGRDDEMKGN